MRKKKKIDCLQKIVKTNIYTPKAKYIGIISS